MPIKVKKLGHTPIINFGELKVIFDFFYVVAKIWGVTFPKNTKLQACDFF